MLSKYNLCSQHFDGQSTRGGLSFFGGTHVVDLYDNKADPLYINHVDNIFPIEISGSGCAYIYKLIVCTQLTT